MNGDLIQALKQIERERGIPLAVLLEAVESALTSSYRKNYAVGSNIHLRIDIDGKGGIQVIGLKTVVSRKKDPETEISLTQAKKSYEKGEIYAIYPPTPEPKEVEGEEDFYEVEKEELKPYPNINIDMLKVGVRVDVLVERNPRSFGRIAAQTTKQVIKQKIREAERDIIYGEYYKKIGQVFSVTVQRHEGRTWVCEIGSKVEGIIPPQEQVHGEHFRRDERIKAYILAVEKTPRGPQIILSRTHPGLICRLFEMEVPEISQNLIEINNVAREPGARSKVSVRAIESNVDPLGACVGPRGSRVQMVVDELRGEKIDIINYTSDPFTFVSNSLSPARVLTVTLNPEDRSALVIVPDDQFSLAIGKEGQNARLAAKLTNWKIDIKSESQAIKLEEKRKLEEKQKQAEEEILRLKEEEEERLKEEEEEIKRKKEEEIKKHLEEEKRLKEEEELRKLREYKPQFDEDENFELIVPAKKDPKKEKEIEEALKHIPDDIPVEQYVAMTFGTNNEIYPEAYYGSRSEEEKPKKKKKKKKTHRGTNFGK